MRPAVHVSSCVRVFTQITKRLSHTGVLCTENFTINRFQWNQFHWNKYYDMRRTFERDVSAVWNLRDWHPKTWTNKTKTICYCGKTPLDTVKSFLLSVYFHRDKARESASYQFKYLEGHLVSVSVPAAPARPEAPLALRSFVCAAAFQHSSKGSHLERNGWNSAGTAKTRDENKCHSRRHTVYKTEAANTPVVVTFKKMSLGEKMPRQRDNRIQPRK